MVRFEIWSHTEKRKKKWLWREVLSKFSCASLCQLQPVWRHLMVWWTCQTNSTTWRSARTALWPFFCLLRQVLDSAPMSCCSIFSRSITTSWRNTALFSSTGQNLLMNMSMYSQAFLCSAASTYLMFVVLIVLSHKFDDDDACDNGF